MFKFIQVIGLIMSVFIVVISIGSVSISWFLIALIAGFFFIAEALIGPFRVVPTRKPYTKRW